MIIVAVDQTHRDLARLIERAMTGEDVVFSRDGVPIAEIIQLPDELGRSDDSASCKARLQFRPTSTTPFQTT